MDPRIVSVLALVEDKPATDTDALASSVHLSASHLRHLFHEQTGKPLHRHIRQRRLDHAETLLLTTFLSVKEISHLVGFRNTCHFVRDFHKAFGVSPGVYRRAAVPANK